MTESVCSTCGRLRDDPKANFCSNSFHLMKNNGAMSFTEGSEPIQLTEQERIAKLIEENKALGEMYTNTFAKLRDLQKEFSDMKANLHRAYNGLENYKNLKEELKQRDETIKQLKEALKEERNKAIDECMREIERLNDDGVLYESTARKVLEFLKSYSS